MLRKIHILIKVIYQELWEWNKFFSHLIKELLGYEDYLENGKYEYLVKAKNMVVIKNERVKNIPPTLQTTFEEFWKVSENKNVQKSLINQIRIILTKVRNTISRRSDYLIISSNYPNKNNIINAQIALLRGNGKILLFDVDKDLIYIKYPKNYSSDTNKFKMADSQFDSSIFRQKIGEFFSLPAEIKISKSFYQQDLIYGDAFSRFNSLERLEIVKKICHSSIRGAENSILSPKYTALNLMEEGFSLASRYVIDPKMLEYIESREQLILDQAKNWTLIPSHCDITAHNITIINKNPILLDTAPNKLGFMPPFFAPICLIHSEVKEYGRLDLVEYFLDGKLDKELSLLIGLKIDSFNKEIRFDLLLAESLALAAKGNKIIPQNIEYWFKPIFDLFNK